MINERNIENSMLRPCVHDPRYDEPYREEKYEGDDIPDKRYEIGGTAYASGIRVKIVGAGWDTWKEEWLYECEPIRECEWAWAEIFEHELSA